MAQVETEKQERSQHRDSGESDLAGRVERGEVRDAPR
jgi:hypothetical protein